MGNSRKEWSEAGDAAFAGAALKDLTDVAVPAELERRILADFDAVASRRGGLAGLLGRWRDAIWPGAPLWVPASMLAASLLIGLTVGALVPSTALSPSTSDQTLASVDTPGFDLSGDL